VYIEYASLAMAVEAERALSGRRFSNRTIVTAFLSEAAWAKKQFT
jgi:hypothetical protein